MYGQIIRMNSFFDGSHLSKPEITLTSTDRMIEWAAWLVFARYSGPDFYPCRRIHLSGTEEKILT